MKLEVVKSEGLAHNNYYLSDGQEAGKPISSVGTMSVHEL
jgi:hypothetical protein